MPKQYTLRLAFPGASYSLAAANGSFLYTGQNATLVPPSGGVVTSFSVTNTSGSTAPAGWITNYIGRSFKQGDIPSGSFPKFELTDTTNIPYTYVNRANWPDGSWRFCGVFLRMPNATNNAASVTINVRANASGPSASGFTTSTITGASDIKTEVVGLLNITGTWTSSLNTGFSDAEFTVLGDGDAGIVYRVYQEFRDASSNHPHFGMWHYVAALKNASGGLYGLRYLGRFANGWHDVSAPTPPLNLGLQSGILLKDGASTLRTISSSYSPSTFTWSSGDLFSSTLGSLPHGTCVTVSTTNTLPAGLSAGTYFANTEGLAANQIKFNSSGKLFFTGAPSNVTATNAGSGTHTLTPGINIAPYAGGPFTCDGTGKWDFIQAGGSASADVTHTVQLDQDYTTQTRIIAPIDRTKTPITALPSRSYAVDQYQDVLTAQGTTGERPDIGWITGYNVRDWIRNNADLQTCRVYALQQSLKMISIKRASTRNWLNITNGTYTNLGTGVPTYVQYTNPAANNSANVGDWRSIFGGYEDHSHQPQLQAYAYLITGEPQYLDMLFDIAVQAMATARNKAPTIASTTYYGVVIAAGNPADAQMRETAWALRDIAWARMFAPDTYSGAPMRQFFDDVLASNMDWLAAEKLNNLSTFARTNKIYPYFDGNKTLAAYWVYYMTQALATVYTATGNSLAATAAQDTIEWFDNVRNNLGLFVVSNIFTGIFPSPGAITEWKGVHPRISYGETVTWDAATDLITANHDPEYGILQDGDTFATYGAAGIGGISELTQYYVRDASGTGAGSTFKLAATPGGAAIDLTNSGSTTWVQTGGWHDGIDNTELSRFDGDGVTNYAMGVWMAQRWVKALGLAIPSGFDTTVENWYTTTVATPYAPFWGNDPKYAINASY